MYMLQHAITPLTVHTTTILPHTIAILSGKLLNGLLNEVLVSSSQSLHIANPLR